MSLLRGALCLPGKKHTHQEAHPEKEIYVFNIKQTPSLWQIFFYMAHIRSHQDLSKVMVESPMDWPLMPSPFQLTWFSVHRFSLDVRERSQPVTRHKIRTEQDLMPCGQPSINRILPTFCTPSERNAKAHSRQWAWVLLHSGERRSYAFWLPLINSLFPLRNSLSLICLNTVNSILGLVSSSGSHHYHIRIWTFREQFWDLASG